MAHELDLRGERQRLYDRYHVLPDGELLDLAAGIDDLTEVAGDVLREEMRSRRLQVERPEAEAAASDSKWWNPGGGGANRGGVTLSVFHDALEAGRACKFLDEQEIEFEIKDVSEPASGLRSYMGGPAVALAVIVPARDQKRAMAILREKMGLFPEQEVDEADAPVDDGTLATLGDFGRREDADGVGQILDDARIWHRITANPEGSVENEDCYTLEVREIDLVRAGEVVEKTMNSRGA